LLARDAIVTCGKKTTLLLYERKKWEYHETIKRTAKNNTMNANTPCHPLTIKTNFRILKRSGSMKTVKRFAIVAVLFTVPFVQPVFSQNPSGPPGKAETGGGEVQYSLNITHYDDASLYYKRTYEWFTAAANRGSAEAQYRLGMMYHEGKSKVVPQDHKKAIEWLKKAADQGYAEAQYNLSLMYSEDEAIEWLTKSAAQGNVFAQIDLGKRYYIGKGMPQDYRKAAEWIAKVANRGDDRAYAVAQFDLGYMYESGQGVPRNYKKAAEWYAKAANNLMMYESGRMSFSHQVNSGATAGSRLRGGIIDLDPVTGCAWVYVSKDSNQKSIILRGKKL
jgi:TPR repeat protein